MPDSNVAPTAVDGVCDLTQYVVPDEISIMACDYSRRSSADDAQWTYLPGLGRGRGCMGITPVTAQSRADGSGAALEYDIEINHEGECVLALGILPTNDINPARGLRIAVAIDDSDPVIVDARQGYVDTFGEYNAANIARSGVLSPLPQPATDIYLAAVGQPMRNEIFDNIRWLSVNLGNIAAGDHTLKIIMVDPELVVEKIIVNPDNNTPSYYGKYAE